MLFTNSALWARPCSTLGVVAALATGAELSLGVNFHRAARRRSGGMFAHGVRTRASLPGSAAVHRSAAAARCCWPETKIGSRVMQPMNAIRPVAEMTDTRLTLAGTLRCAAEGVSGESACEIDPRLRRRLVRGPCRGTNAGRCRRLGRS
jgi:hypothetical protein